MEGETQKGTALRFLFGKISLDFLFVMTVFNDFSWYFSISFINFINFSYHWNDHVLFGLYLFSEKETNYCVQCKFKGVFPDKNTTLRTYSIFLMVRENSCQKFHLCFIKSVTVTAGVSVIVHSPAPILKLVLPHYPWIPLGQIIMLLRWLIMRITWVTQGHSKDTNKTDPSSCPQTDTKNLQGRVIQHMLLMLGGQILR